MSTLGPLLAVSVVLITITTPLNAADLFTFVSDVRLRALKPGQLSALDNIKKESTTKSVHVIQIDTAQFMETWTEIPVSRDKRFLANRTTLDERAPSDYTWVGTIQEMPGEAIFVVRDGYVTGMIRTGAALYRISPFVDTLSTLTEIDQSKFPPDDPPDFYRDQNRIPAEPEQRGEELDTRGPFTKVLVAYTPAAVNAYQAIAPTGAITDLIRGATVLTNRSYSNSGIHIVLTLAGTTQVSYSEAGNDEITIVDHLASTGDGFMDDVHQLRNELAADIVVLITDRLPSACGRAKIVGADAETAFAITSFNCAVDNLSFAHEIGHLQGARHDRDQDSSPGFNHGFKNCSNWRTMMAYDCNFQGSTCPLPQNPCARIPYWSNPDVQINSVPTGTADFENNALMLNSTARTISLFRPDCRGIEAAIRAHKNNCAERIREASPAEKPHVIEQCNQEGRELTDELHSCQNG